jgi:hypothetical protein
MARNQYGHVIVGHWRPFQHRMQDALAELVHGLCARFRRNGRVGSFSPRGCGLKYAATMSHQLKITLQDIAPLIWRRVLVPSEYTLFDLHCVIQTVMGWEDCHLHEFTIKRQRYSLPDPDGFDISQALSEDDARLVDVATPRTKFVYHYDFGDSWRHAIVVEKVDPKLSPPVPHCIAGARACPPEDCGGPWRYSEKVRALSSEDDEEADELRDWFGDFDPELFELEAVNKQLEQMFLPVRRKKKRSARRA